jgi:hypothetical protein
VRRREKLGWFLFWLLLQLEDANETTKANLSWVRIQTYGHK